MPGLLWAHHILRMVVLCSAMMELELGIAGWMLPILVLDLSVVPPHSVPVHIDRLLGWLRNPAVLGSFPVVVGLLQVEGDNRQPLLLHPRS